MEVPDVIVGDGECTYKDIVDIFLKESVSSKTTTEWRELAGELTIEGHKIQKWDQERTLNQKTISDVFVDVLTEWRFSTGATATLGNLVAHLRKIKWNAVADELSNASQKKSAEPVSESQRLPDTIPEKLSYYVPRRLLANNRISLADLTSAVDSNNVFVFIGISYDDLKLKVKDEVARSGEMISKENIDTRYILLEQDEDWQKLCETCKKSLHLVQIKNGYLICLRSHGQKNNFRKVLIAKGEKDEFSEETFLNVVNETGNQKLELNIPICIADSPGMGKSILLAELGRQLKEKCSDREVAYIVVPEYIESIKKSHEKIFEDRVKLALIEKLSYNKNLRDKLKSDFDSINQSTVTKYEFLFDGFDEIQSQDFEFGYKCLTQLVKCLRHCARLWVTTRLHLLEELENCLGVCGYRIQPFNHEDKLNFLVNYWSPKDRNANSRRLKFFSESCLTAVESKVSDRERDILGIPLLCQLLAEVYETKARDFCGSNVSDKPDAKPQRPHFEIKSITALYQSFIKNRIRKGFGLNESDEDILESYRTQINRQKDLHVYISMELIFPDTVNSVLSHYPVDELKYEKKGERVLKIGIVEAPRMKDEVRFLHRTIAEYFVAKFLVDSIPEESSGEITRFFFETLSSDYYPNIRYFTDCLLKQNPQKYDMNISIRFAKLVGAGSLSGALESLIKQDLVNIFKLFHVAFGKELSYQPSVIKDWKYKAVKYSSLEMINFIYEYYHDLPVISKLEREDVSLLTETIQNGDVDKFNCLLNNHGYYDILYRLKFTKVRECLKACLYSGETRLQQHLHIFNKLINIHPINIAQENLLVLCKGLYFLEIHAELLIELLRHGIGLVEKDKGNVSLYEGFVSRHNDTLPLKCFLHAFAEGIWKTIVRLNINEQNMLIGYMENDISLHDLKEIPLLCFLLSELEKKMEQMVDSSVSRKIAPQKRCKVVHIVNVYEHLMKQLSCNNSLCTTKSNLENVQILLAFKFLAINLPREVEQELTASIKDHKMYKLYKSQVAKLKEIPTSSVIVKNIVANVVDNCLVADYTLNTLYRSRCPPTVTFLFEAVLRVTSTKVETSGGTYFKEYKFVHQDLCCILDKLISKRNEPAVISIVKVESYFFDILAASLCQKFKSIFSLFLDKLKLTLRPMAEVSSHLEEASLETLAPLNCFQLINRISKLALSEIKGKVFSVAGFILLIEMQEETADYDMLKTILAAGVDINSRDERGFTLLDYTVKEKRFDIANILLGLGAKFGTEYYKGQNLLHTIVEHQEKELFKTIMYLPLLNINEMDSDGNTALHVALMQSNTSEDLYYMVIVLIGRGAQLDIKNKNGETPISLAEKRNDFVGKRLRRLMQTINT